jgi:hypothetical protein
MKTPVQGIVVLPSAVVAHVKNSHGGFWPVIRNIADYGVPWPTIGAVDKGIEVSPVLLVKEFLEAIAAGCCVRRYEGCSPFPLFTGFDLEIVIISGRQFLGVYLGNACQWWGCLREFFEKMLKSFLASFYLYFYTSRCVSYIAV